MKRKRILGWFIVLQFFPVVCFIFSFLTELICTHLEAYLFGWLLNAIAIGIIYLKKLLNWCFEE